MCSSLLVLNAALIVPVLGPLPAETEFGSFAWMDAVAASVLADVELDEQTTLLDYYELNFTVLDADGDDDITDLDFTWYVQAYVESMVSGGYASVEPEDCLDWIDLGSLTLQACVGDINGSGAVTAADLAAVENWNASAGVIGYDTDLDGDVDEDDEDFVEGRLLTLTVRSEQDDIDLMTFGGDCVPAWLHDPTTDDYEADPLGPPAGVVWEIEYEHGGDCDDCFELSAGGWVRWIPHSMGQDETNSDIKWMVVPEDKYEPCDAVPCFGEAYAPDECEGPFRGVDALYICYNGVVYNLKVRGGSWGAFDDEWTCVQVESWKDTSTGKTHVKLTVCTTFDWSHCFSWHNIFWNYGTCCNYGPTGSMAPPDPCDDGAKISELPCQ